MRKGSVNHEKNYGFCVACFTIETFGNTMLGHDCVTPVRTSVRARIETVPIRVQAHAPMPKTLLHTGNPTIIAGTKVMTFVSKV